MQHHHCVTFTIVKFILNRLIPNIFQLSQHLVTDRKSSQNSFREIRNRILLVFFVFGISVFVYWFVFDSMSVCRALGIPCRSVTNFGSAHDCDSSITIDVHWTFKGDSLEEFNTDSIWYEQWNKNDVTKAAWLMALENIRFAVQFPLYRLTVVQDAPANHAQCTVFHFQATSDWMPTLSNNGWIRETASQIFSFSCNHGLNLNPQSSFSS